MLHFAYGSNMALAVMRKHAPAAVPLGLAQLAGYRFVITADGYASIAPAPAPAHAVHGVMWRLTPRDRVTLDLWEGIGAGQYRAAILPVLQDGRSRRALVYLARRQPVGKPKPGYMEVVVKAAREWDMAADYIASLERWLSIRPLGAGHRKLGDFV